MVATGDSKLLNVDAQEPETLTPEIMRARVNDCVNWWAISRKDSNNLRRPPMTYGHSRESFSGMSNDIDHTQTIGPDDMMRPYAYRG